MQKAIPPPASLADAGGGQVQGSPLPGARELAGTGFAGESHPELSCPLTLQCSPLAPLPPPPSQSLLLHLMVTPPPAAIAFHATSEAATLPTAMAMLQAYSTRAERGPEDPCALVSAGKTLVVIVFSHHGPALQRGFCRHHLTSSPGLPLM